MARVDLVPGRAGADRRLVGDARQGEHLAVAGRDRDAERGEELLAPVHVDDPPARVHARDAVAGEKPLLLWVEVFGPPAGYDEPTIPQLGEQLPEAVLERALTRP